MTFDELIQNFRKTVRGRIETLLINQKDVDKFGGIPEGLKQAVLVTDNVGPGYFIVEESNGFSDEIIGPGTKVHYLCIHGNNYIPFEIQNLSEPNCNEPECVVLSVLSS